MGDADEHLDPIINNDEFNELIELLYCHGLYKEQPNLLYRISEKCPEFPQATSPHRQLVTLLAYCKKFQKDGPLPALRDTLFIHTLHDGVVGILKTEQKLVEMLTRDITYKLVLGIKSLLTRSILISPKFLVKDVQRTITSYFPVLPVRPSNSQFWENWAQILNIDLEEDSDLLSLVSSTNAKSEKHFRDKLDNLPVERRKTCHDESIMIIWNSIAPKFDDFVRLLTSLLPKNFLEEIVHSSHPKLRMLAQRVGPDSCEEEVIGFLDHLCDIYVESEF